jgi:hypothetical protein
MKIPKVISKNNHEYILVKQINDKMFLYKDLLYGYKECFTRYDLGLVKEIVKAEKEHKPKRAIVGD